MGPSSGFRPIAGNRFLLAEGNGGRIDEAGAHVAPDHHVTHDVADYLAYDVTIGVHLGFGVRVGIDLFVRAREHVLVSSTALVDPAVVLAGIYVGELTRVPAVIRPVLVTGRSGQ